MPETYSEMLEVLNAMKKNPRCLRCGECCYNWEAHNVPNYSNGINPVLENCKHLKPTEKNEQNKKWQKNNLERLYGKI